MSFLYKTKEFDNKYAVYILGIPVIKVRTEKQILKLYVLGIRIFRRKLENMVTTIQTPVSAQECIDSLVDTIERLAKFHLDTNLAQMYDTSGFDIKAFKGKSVVQFSTWKVVCGLASFAQSLQRGFDALKVLKKNDVIALDRSIVNHNSYMENEQYLQNIIDQMAGYDVIILQHEYSLYMSDKYDLFQSVCLFADFVRRIVEIHKKARVVVYLHTSPDVIYHFRSIKVNQMVEAFKMLADMERVSFIGNTPHIVTELYKYNINSALGVDPVKPYIYAKNIESVQNAVKKGLNLQKGDVVIAMLGMINMYKRNYAMAEMLADLPDNYKLLIIGGVPQGQEQSGKKLNLAISKNHLEKRVYITGRYRDEDLYTYLNLADIMAAPYSNAFKFGSSSVPALLQAQKPLVAYDIDSISLLNKQSAARPIIIIEYDNQKMFIEKIKELTENKKTCNAAIAEIKKYTEEVSEEKLARLTLKALDSERRL